VNIIAPPIGVLLAVNGTDDIVPSQYALDIKSLGFDIITWSFARADLRNGAVGAGFLLRLRSDRPRAQKRQRYVQGAGRARSQGRRHRHLLRLASNCDLLRELHGIEVIANDDRRAGGNRAAGSLCKLAALVRRFSCNTGCTMLSLLVPQ
jgi:hypothetical protein